MLAATVLAIESLVFIGVYVKYREFTPKQFLLCAGARHGVHRLRQVGPGTARGFPVVDFSISDRVCLGMIIVFG